MRIIYLTNSRLPTQKAHGLQIMKTCEYFKKLGNEVELVTARRLDPDFKDIDPFEYYGIKERFKIKKIINIDLTPLELARYWGPLGFWVQAVSFAIGATIYLLFKRDYDLIYSRDEFSLYLLSFFKKIPFVYEIHNFPKSKLFFYKRIFRKTKKLVVITQELKKLLIKNQVPAGKIIVAPDGVEIEDFQVFENQADCREKFGLPLDKKIVLYSGHLFRWKGVYVLLEAAEFLGQEVLVVFVGGMLYDVNKLKVQSAKLKVNNVLIVGYRPPKEIPFWLKAADVLVLPNSAKYKASEFYTSPLKLFEYMAVQKPIIASDLPSIREILNKDNAILVLPDDSQKLAQAINFVLTNEEFCDKISEQANQDVAPYSWLERVKKILDFISL